MRAAAFETTTPRQIDVRPRTEVARHSVDDRQAKTLVGSRDDYGHPFEATRRRPESCRPATGAQPILNQTIHVFGVVRGSTSS
jgi:hypothetical protein